ncbi:MAG: serine hydrolase [Roseiarcus sp.]|uniref:serine hydrolase domain-containing protein n=1 Tax=Roseiarcus sp. TaxID=1969460 RepID=UPI003BB08F00
MRLMKRLATALIAAQFLTAFSALAATPDCPSPSQTPWPTRDWEASTPEEQGMDSAALAELVDRVGAYKQDSLLIIRHGKIVADAYYAPYAPNIRHDLRSVTKSFTGTLTAIELRKGFLDSVDHPIVDLFADKHISNLDDGKKAMTVQNMLDMTSGIAWNERFYSPDETVSEMYKSPDRVDFVLSQPMSNPPGARFYYDSGNPYVLSALITRKTGRDALDFARDELFKPLGISNARWDTDAEGVTDGESGLYLTPRDMAKLGYLYLHEGSWDGEQIIPSSWVDRVRQGPVKATDGYHYANFWWSLPERDAFMARGRHSQLILVLPKLDVVAVMTGALKDGYFPTTDLIDGVTGAIKSDAALPPDSAAQSVLAASIEKAATERASPVRPAPELAKAISGKSYRLQDNDLHVKAFSLNLVDPNPSWEYTIATQRLDRPTARFSGPIGLDGLYRKASSRAGIDAVKGSWLDDHTFQVDRRILGQGETQRWTLAFDGDKVDLNFESSDGVKAELHGEAEE